MLTGLPENAAAHGAQIDGLITLIYWICGCFFVAAEVALIGGAWVYRRRAGRRARWFPADTWRTRAWVLVPVVLVLFFDLWIEHRSARVWAQMRQTPPAVEVLVRATGRQFMWSFTYAGADAVLDTADDFQVPNELVLPVGRQVRLQIESADVLHSFWVPELRFKQDAVPGRSIPGWFEPIRVGEYTIACAELCGVGHGKMKGSLSIREAAAFDAWMASHAAPPATPRRTP